ncbi:unnamed protein product [Zymoseptoria tritici ST99CH_3D1]|nr:unnamed protein product [Zymoseptoria tritici ST99CH_3D1]
MSSASRLAVADTTSHRVMMDNEGTALTAPRTHNMITGAEPRAQRELSSTTDSPQIEDYSPQASFMGIPPELRLLVYEAMCTPMERRYTIHNEHFFNGGDYEDHDGHAYSRRDSERSKGDKNSAALLLVNRQVSHEAKLVVYGTATLTLLAAGKSLWPLLHAHPTPNARAHITSINIHSLGSQNSYIPLLHQDYPSLETLQVFATFDDFLLWESVVRLFYKLISKTFENPMLKRVAIELSHTPLFNTIWAGDYPDCRRLCYRLRTRLEDILRRMGKSTTVEVLWRDCHAVLYVFPDAQA